MNIGDKVTIDDGFFTKEYIITGFRDTLFGRKVYYNYVGSTDGWSYGMMLYRFNKKIITTKNTNSKKLRRT